MAQIPEPDVTPAGPAYEGRLLTRPDDELVDQGAAFDASTLITRRRVLVGVGLGVGALTLAACTSPATGTSTPTATSTGSATPTAVPTPSATPTEDPGSDITAAAGEIPEETNGPYPADGTNGVTVLDESGIVRSDVRSSLDGGTTVAGVTFTLTMLVTDLAAGNVPLAGAAVYIWQCDAAGLYSMYSQGAEDETYLRGIQVADDNGEVTFTTIVPGCYTGRWTHIHFEIYPDLASATDVANAIATSQLAFPAEMLSGIYARDEYSGSARNLADVGSIEQDMVFGDGGDWSLQVPTITGDIDNGYVGTLAVAVDETTENVVSGGGGAPGGGQGGGPGGNGP